MKPREVKKNYNVNKNGIITSPGKFEREPAYAVHFWDAAMDGFGDTHYDEYDSPVDFFEVTDDDLKDWPDLEDIYGVSLYTDDSGFVHLQEYETKEGYESAIDELDSIEREEEDY